MQLIVNSYWLKHTALVSSFFLCVCNFAFLKTEAWWLSGLDIDCGSSGPGSISGREHCVVFLGKTLYSYSAPLHPDANLMLWVTLPWTSIPSRGEQTLDASYYRNQDKLRLDRPIASCADFLPLPLMKACCTLNNYNYMMDVLKHQEGVTYLGMNWDRIFVLV